MPAFALVLTLASLLASGAAAARSDGLARETDANRRLITRFASLFYDKRDVRGAFERYVSVHYVQHSPGIADGREAAIRVLTPMFARPDLRIVHQPPIVDGDRAVILVHAGVAGERGGAIADIFRLSHGRIVEHWDVNQPLPAKASNPHPLF